jgi:hypothetical protein
VLAVNPSGTNTSTVSACDSYTWAVNGVTYTQSGTYSYFDGCGTEVLILTITDSNSSTTTVTACNSYVWSVTGFTYFESGTYSSGSGCDLQILELTIFSGGAPSSPSKIALSQIGTVSGCSTRVYEYRVTRVPGSTMYSWRLPATIGGAPSNARIIFANFDSSIINVEYNTLLASGRSDVIEVRSVNACGVSAWKSVVVKIPAIKLPVPSMISVTLVSDVCGARVYQYTAPAMTGATATSPAATGWQWTMPTGPVGSTGTLVQGTLNDRVIQISYSSNAGASRRDVISVAYVTDCGVGPNYSMGLTNVAKKGCPNTNKQEEPQAITKVESDLILDGGLDIQAFPNPSVSSFKLRALTSGVEQIHIRVMDVQGKEYKRLYMMPGETLILGSELRPGTYMIQAIQGKKMKTVRVIKLKLNEE